jgi:HNH endonuclease
VVGSGEVVSAAAALESIRGGLAMLAACDIDESEPTDLGNECTQILRAAGCLQLEAARRLRCFDSAGGPAADDCSSLAAWLGRRCRLRPWEAKQLAALSARHHLLTDTLAAFGDHEIEFGDVTTIAEGIDRAADTMTDSWSPERIAQEAQPTLLEAAATATPGQLRKAATRIALTLDGESAERRRRQIDRQAFLNLGQSIDGIGILSAEMGADDLAIVEKAVDAFAPSPDAEVPRWQNLPGHRRLRGLVTACQIALDSARRRGHRERGGAPVRVHVIASTATVDPAVPTAEAPPGRTEYGTILTAAQVREMIQRHDAGIHQIRIDPDGSVADRFTADGQPLNWGRTRRLFSSAQRDVFLALYAGCAAEGCDRPPAWADIDHKQPWAEGGRTDLDNGQPLCRWHNLQKQNRHDRAGPAHEKPPDRPGGAPPASDD